MNESIKIVVVGDGSVGKTCMLLSYAENRFPTEYVPTIFENYQTTVHINGEAHHLQIWYDSIIYPRDTAGQEGYDKLRLLSYTHTNIFLILFAIDDQVSFDNAINKWLPEIKQNAQQDKVILFVGTKIDKRDDLSKHIQKTAAHKIFKNQGYNYSECSALTQEGVKETIDLALKTLLKRQQSQKEALDQQKQKKKKKKSCTLI